MALFVPQSVPVVNGKVNEPVFRSVEQSQSLVPVFFNISPFEQVWPSGRSSPSNLMEFDAYTLVEVAFNDRRLVIVDEPTVSLPMMAVLDLSAVVEARPETKNSVVVAPPWPTERIVEEALFTASKREPRPQMVREE